MLDKIKNLKPVKDLFIKQESHESEKKTKAFIMDLIEIKNKLYSVRTMFNTINDEDLVESLIYEEQALLSRYQYMIKQAKLKGIKSELILNSNF